MTIDPGLRLALLTNFIPPYRVPVFQELARRFGMFRVLISTTMEADRFWAPESGGLDVHVQKNYTISVPWNHPSGFKEKIYIHFPYDTMAQLERFRPDVIISAEFGFRTLNALLYRLLMRRSSRIVIWATISEETEAQRSFVRILLRHFMVRFADAVMTNGRSGIRYLEKFRSPSEKLFAVPQTTDVGAFATVSCERQGAAAHRLIYAGRLVLRKQVVQFIDILGEWCRANPARHVEFWVAGDGPERPLIEGAPRPANLDLRMLGNIAYTELPEMYEQAGALVLPTLADEWGLVVNEALAAGLPVLGSSYSQAVQDMVEDARNGWTYSIDRREQVLAKLDAFFHTSEQELNVMRRTARETALRLTPGVVVDRMMDAIRFARRDEPAGTGRP
jgi:glycosyltransferase involved in cell wall biosynthesis